LAPGAVLVPVWEVKMVEHLAAAWVVVFKIIYQLSIVIQI
jgi:hypothetical protein